MCGSLAMGNDVMKTLHEFIVLKMGETEANTKDLIAKLEKDGRIVKELW